MEVADLGHFQRAEGRCPRLIWFAPSALCSYLKIGTDDWDHRCFRSYLKMEVADLGHFQRAEGPVYTSLGQRPRYGDKNPIEMG